MKTDRAAVAHWYQAGLATGLLCGALAAILIIMAETFPAKAQGSKSWTGCYVGAHGGYSVTATETTATTPFIGGAALTIDGFSGEGLSGGLGVGCDYQMQRVVMGGFADYSFQDVEFTAGLSIPAFPFSAGASLSIENSWTIGGRLGVLLNDSTLAYGLVGYTQAKSSDLALTSTIGDISFSVPDFSGWTVGAGIETRLTDALYLAGEYRYTMFDSETVAILPGALDLGLEPDVHSIRMALRYKFGASEPLSLK